MRMYIVCIICAMTFIACINIWLGSPIFEYSPWFVILAVIVTTIFQIAIDGLIAFIFARVPDNKFSLKSKFFNISKKQQRFYEKLGIKKWKDYVVDLGKLNGFSKSKVQNPNSVEYIDKFLIESHRGVWAHRIGCVAGFLGIFLFPLEYAIVIGIPVAIVNLILSGLPILILKYNVPKLQAVKKRLIRLDEQQIECKNKYVETKI